ncbi:hypothetical protein ACE6H2_023467 [Prunus campanulata]
MRPHGQLNRAHYKAGGRDSPGFMGSHHHTSRSQMSIGLPTCANQAPLCRFLASITLPGTLPINTKLKTTFKGFKHQTKASHGATYIFL